ncbi:MAG: tetratricopeptide repeat protein [Chitinophagales bacterium]
MNSERIQKLKEMEAQSPGDAFFPYAVGLELLAGKDGAGARRQFEMVLQRFPDYVPVYYQLGQLLDQFGETAAARRILFVGIEKATQAGDAKTVRELQAAIDML